MPRGFSFAKRVRGQTTLFHCVRLFFAPRVFFCQAGARPLVAYSSHPASGGGLAALRDSLDRDPEARPVPGPLGVSRLAGSPTPRPGPRAGSPRSRETWPLAPARRFETPTLRLETLKPGSGGSVAGPLERFNRQRGDGGEIRPAGDKSHGAEACGHRVCRSLCGDVGGRRPNHEGPRGERHPSVAREGGSEGCARCAARATAPSPRGKKTVTQ